MKPSISNFLAWLRKKRNRPTPRYSPCPLCGEPVREGALACRSCGSDASTGWSEDIESSSVDLGPAGDDFDYEEFIQREFSGGKLRQRKWSSRSLGVTLLVLLLVALLLFAWV